MAKDEHLAYSNERTRQWSYGDTVRTPVGDDEEHATSQTSPSISFSSVMNRRRWMRGKTARSQSRDLNRYPYDPDRTHTHREKSKDM